MRWVVTCTSRGGGEEFVVGVMADNAEQAREKVGRSGTVLVVKVET